MIRYEEALACVLEQVTSLPTCRVPVAQAEGRVLATPVLSAADLPPFDNSAMDGAAFFTGGKSLPEGAEFHVLGVQCAGDESVSLPAAQQHAACWQIMTGARMPTGTDSVMPIEQLAILASDANGRPTRLRLQADLLPGRNVRQHGEDVAVGDPVLTAGRKIDAAALAMLAALGVTDVEVAAPPRVALLCTGNELVDDPHATLGTGQIRNINAPFLASRLRTAGAELVANATVPDVPAAFDAMLAHLATLHCDVIISCGAVSMGDFDFVPEALKRAGAEIFFHKVRMRPGKPILFARLPDGCWYFGLPGNPVSSAVGLRFFVEPALRRLQGLPAEKPLYLPLSEDYRRHAPWQLFLKGSMELDGAGRLVARVLAGQESFRIRPLLDANCWIALPGVDGLAEAGDLVEVYALGQSEAWCLQRT